MFAWMKGFDSWSAARRRWLCYGTLVLVMAVDFFTGAELSVMLFYLIPICLAAWSLSWLDAWAAACLAAGEYLLEGSGSFTHFSWILGWNSVALFLFLTLFAVVSTELRKYREQAELSARVDFLTRAENRRAFFAAAEEELKRSRRYGHAFSVVFMDLDDFKKVNDQFGHPVGDQVLMTVVQTMREHLRDTDHIGRLGGDEFMLLLPQSDAEQSRLVLDRLQETLLKVMQAHDWPVTFSLGVATFLRPPENVEDMVHTADQLMVAVKTHGKNRLYQEIFN
jgi:diguanylate cyclase (GGDEF)-like protein